VQERDVRRAAGRVSDRRMNSILRALAARWPIIAVTTLACLLGGLWVATTSAPRYQGSARVVLDYIRPDPVTGAVVPSKMLDAYLVSQIRMLRDQQVAAPAAEILGWMDSPDVLAAYAARPAGDSRDLAAWVSGILIPRIGARMIEDSNILEISYNGESEEISRAAADALRTAYIQSSIQAKQEASRGGAERIQANIDRLKVELAELETVKAGVEAETGVVLGPTGSDDASRQVALMAGRPRAPVVLDDTDVATPAGLQLAQLDAAIAKASQVLGPNNPDLSGMMVKREVLRAQVAGKRSVAQAASAAVVASDQASAALFESLKSRVLETREPALRLRLLQDEIDGRQDEFRSLTETLVLLRSLQTQSISSITPTGEAYSEPKPVFPNNALILGGSGAIGLAIGGIMACLLELTDRRVRTRRHLEAAASAVVLIEVPNLRPSGRKRGSERRRGTLHAPDPGLMPA
jgi:succinoglycan biosynthesis transport protein ExoP